MANTLVINGTYCDLDFTTAGSGVSLIEWRQVTPSYKDGGVMIDSKIAPDRRPAYRQETSHVETIKFGLYAATEDALAAKLECIRIISDESFDYWLPGSFLTSPVYISAQVRDEPGIRYAYIYKMELTGELPDLYNSEYQTGIGANGTAYAFGLSNLSLTIERSAWMSHAPGSGGTVTLTTYEDNLISTNHEAGNQSAAVLIGSDDILGDMPAIGKITLADFDEYLAAGISNGSHAILGLRSTDRGANFIAYLNMVASPPAVFSIVTAHGSSIVADATSPTGEGLQYTTALAINEDFLKIRFDSIAHFKGRFRVFARAKISAGAPEVLVGLYCTVNFKEGADQAPTATKYIATLASAATFVFDLGEISIPISENYSLSGATEDMDLHFYAVTDAAATVVLQQVILMPTDEYICDVDSGHSGQGFADDYSLAIDSITQPKVPTLAVGYTTTPTRIRFGATVIASHSRLLIPQRREMKLWFFAYSTVSAATPYAVNINATVSLLAAFRYSTLRRSS